VYETCLIIDVSPLSSGTSREYEHGIPIKEVIHLSKTVNYGSYSFSDVLYWAPNNFNAFLYCDFFKTKVIFAANGNWSLPLKARIKVQYTKL